MSWEAKLRDVWQRELRIGSRVASFKRGRAAFAKLAPEEQAEIERSLTDAIQRFVSRAGGYFRHRAHAGQSKPDADIFYSARVFGTVRQWRARILAAAETDDVTFFVRLGRSLAETKPIDEILRRDRIAAFLVVNWIRRRPGEVSLCLFSDGALTKVAKFFVGPSITKKVIQSRRRSLGLIKAKTSTITKVDPSRNTPGSFLVY